MGLRKSALNYFSRKSMIHTHTPMSSHYAIEEAHTAAKRSSYYCILEAPVHIKKEAASF